LSPHLLAVTAPGVAKPLLAALQSRASGLTLDVAEAVEELTDALARTGYDAAVCWADHPEDLEILVRIRKTAPRLPILLLSFTKDPSFKRLAIEKGASNLLPANRDAELLLDTVEQALILVRATKGLQLQVARAQGLTRDIVRLTSQTTRLLRESRDLVRQDQAPLLRPLVVADDPEQAQMILGAIGNAAITTTSLPVVKSPAEAIAYLSGVSPFQDARAHPCPSLVLLSLKGPGGADLELVVWMRKRAELRKIPVIIMSATLHLEDIDRAIGSYSSIYTVSPGSEKGLVRMLQVIHLYWSSLNTHRIY